MAERRSHPIEYAFEGNTLSLQEAIKQVNDLLTSSIKKLKQYQDGAITEGQNKQVKATRKLLKQMKDAAKIESTLTSDKKRATITAGKEAIKQAIRFASQTDKVKNDSVKEESARLARITELTSISGQENAKQHAAFLDEYADRLKHTLSPEAYDEVRGAVADYNLAIKDSSLNQEELADITDRLQATYKNYSETLQSAVRAQQSANKGILSFSALMSQAKVYLETTIKSFSFWLQLLSRVANLLKQGAEDAAAYIESVNFLNVTIGESNQKFRDFIKLQEAAFGLNPTELNESAATFYSFGNAIGFTKEQTDVAAESLTKLAMDLASLRNTDLEPMTIALRSAMAGNTKPLMKFGIAVHDAAVEEWLLSQGINTSMKAMSEASQAAARYAFIIDKTGSAQGDLARTLQSPANQLKILRTQFKLLFQNIGGIFLNLIMPVVRILNIVLQPINALLKAMTALSSQAITTSIGSQVDAFDELGEAGSEASLGLASFDDINLMGDASGSNPLAGMDKNIAALISGYDNLAEKASPLVTLFTKIGEAMAPVFNFLGKPLTLAFDVLETFTPILSAILVPLQYLMDGLGWLLDKILTPILAVVDTLTSNVWLLVTALTSVAALLIITNWTQFLALLPKIAAGIKAITIGIWDNIKAFIAWIGTQIKAAATAIATTVKNWILAGSYWKIAVAAVAAAGVLAAVVGAIVITAATAAESKAKSNMNSDYGAPALAKGGVVTAPTMALVGEGSYNEVVMPLGNSPQFASMKQEIATEVADKTSAPSSSQSVGDVKVYVTIGETPFNSFVYKVVNEANKRNNGISLDKISQKVGKM